MTLRGFFSSVFGFSRVEPSECEASARTLGDRGEAAAAKFIKAEGFRIIEKNFRCKSGEIDIIARDGDTVVFVEVKTRSSDGYGSPVEAVGPVKIRRIIRASETYLATHSQGRRSHQPYPAPHPPKAVRYDVVSVELKDGRLECELIKDAFGSDF